MSDSQATKASGTRGKGAVSRLLAFAGCCCHASLTSFVIFIQPARGFAVESKLRIIEGMIGNEYYC